MDVLDVRPIAAEDYEAASAFVGREFMQEASARMTEAGVAVFRDLVQPDAFRAREAAGAKTLVAVQRGEIIGLLHVRQSHVSLFFVAGWRQRRGVGRRLFNALDSALRLRTVHSSIDAVGAYEKLGFRKAGPEQLRDGLRFIPMERKRGAENGRMDTPSSSRSARFALRRKAMDSALQEKPRGELTIKIIAMPADTNANGDIFGGWVLSQMDAAGGIAGVDRAGGRVVTIKVDTMTFIRPIRVGDVLNVFTEVETVGRTSMKIHIEAWVNRFITNKLEKVTDATFTFVAIDDQGRPRPIPKEESARTETLST